MRFVCLALVACGAGSNPLPIETGDIPGRVPSTTHAPVGPVSGMHGSAISLIAPADRGDTVITADTDGAMRLWPTLDATREPIVVTGQRPRALAVARDDAGFTIANQDAAQGVEIVRLDLRGVVTSRTVLPQEPLAVEVAVMAAGVIVLRADQAIEVVAPTGTVRARLVADPATRIGTVLVREGRALAILIDGTEVRGRWIELAGATPTWGERTPPLELDPAFPIALSPDHATVLATSNLSREASVIVELANGTQRGDAICVGSHKPRSNKQLAAQPFDDPTRSPSFLPSGMGFVDAQTIACSIDSMLAWWTAAGAPLGGAVEPVPLDFALPFAVADGRFLVPQASQLEIHSPAGTTYLGYGFRELSHMRIAPTGIVIGKGDQAPLLLDRTLHESARFALPKQDVEWTDLEPLDDQHWLTSSSRAMPMDAWGSFYQLTVFDATKRAVHQQLPNLAQEIELAYEPATRLLASSDGGKNILLRFDPVTHSFTERFELDKAHQLRSVHLLDPALSGGLVALTIEDLDGALTVGEIHGDDLRAGTVTARRVFEVPGQLRSVDRTGHVLAQTPLGTDVIVYSRGLVFSRLPGVGGMSLRPSPDGTRVAAVLAGRVVMVAIDGRVLWETALWNSRDVAWTAQGDLVVRYPRALAKLDPETGRLLERQCGWGFGLTDKPLVAVEDGPLVCDVAP